jgi:predicted PurR-regulated permease PerM
VPESAQSPPENRTPAVRRGPVRRKLFSTQDVIRGVAAALGLYFLLQLIWLVHPVLLTGFIGLLFGLGVARGADFLERFKVPRGVSAGLIVLATYGALVGVLAIAAPTLEKQFGELRARLPEATDRVDQWIAANKGQFWGQVFGSSEGEEGAGEPAAATPGSPPVPTPAAAGRAAAAGPAGGPSGGAAGAQLGGTGALAPPPSGAVPPPAKPGAPVISGAAAGSATAAPAKPGSGAIIAAAPLGGGAAAAPPASPLRQRLARQLGAATRYLFPFLSSTVEVLAGLLLITFVALYFGLDPGVYRRGLLHLVPHPSRQRADEVLAAIGETLRRWLRTQVIAMVVIGSMVSISLALLGVEAALSLGIIAGVFEFIPTVGPILSAMPAIAMGFLVSPQKALEVAVVFTLVEMVEGHLLIPMLMKRGMNLPPLLTILGQAVMAIVFGFLGLLVAVPLVATVLIAVRMLYVDDVVGDGAASAESVAQRARSSAAGATPAKST